MEMRNCQNKERNLGYSALAHMDATSPGLLCPGAEAAYYAKLLNLSVQKEF